MGNFSPKVRKILPEVEDRGQYFTNRGGKIPIMIDDPSCYLFCYTSTQKLCIIRSVRIK